MGSRSSPSRFDTALLLLLVVALLGVAAAGFAATAPSGGPGEAAEGSRPNTFPSAEELERLSEKALPDAAAAFSGLDVESWQLEGPFPVRAAVTAAAGADDWERLAARAAGERAGLTVPTDAMHCVARQIGRFNLAHQALPLNGLQAFIASRCNASVADYQIGMIHADVPAEVPESELYAQWHAELESRLRPMLSGGPQALGIWFGREADRVVVVMVTGNRAVNLEPDSGSPDASGRFRLAGEVLAPAADVRAMVGRGRFGFAACERDPEVVLPRFAFACEADPADAQTIVSVGYTPLGRLLSKAGMHLLLSPSGTLSDKYERPSYGKKRNVATAQALRARFIEAVNEVRADAGLRAVTEATKQSAVASEVAPHYFAAMRGLTAEVDADTVVMGLLAGWNVDGLVQQGNFTASWVTSTSDVNRLLSDTLEYPAGRAVLLAPQVDQIAVGAIIGDDQTVLAAVVNTYELYSQTEQAGYLTGLYERFQAERSARDRKPAERLQALETLNTAAAERIQRGVEASDAVEQLLQSSAEILQRPVTGWVSEASSLDDIEFPDDLLDRPELDISIGVSYYKPNGAAWGRFVVTIVAAEPALHSI